MLQHSNHLEAEYGAGPHTISVPRLRPADGSDLSIRPPYEVIPRGTGKDPMSCVWLTQGSSGPDLNCVQ
jgi:hypothetical protein